jgi:cell division protein FtsL
MAAPASLARSEAPRTGASSTRRPRLEVVAPTRHAGRYALLLVALGILGVFGIVSLNAMAAESAFEARALEAEVRELSLRYDELTAEVAHLASPERVREVAVAELGMVPAEQPQFLVADAGTPVGSSAPSRVSDPIKPVLGASR